MNTPQEIIAEFPRTTSDLIDYDGQAFYTWSVERLESGGYCRSGSTMRERYNRMHDASEHGCDGQTHREHIDDFREYAKSLHWEFSRRLQGAIYDAQPELSVDAETALMDELDAALAVVIADCDRLETWHIENGSIDDET